MPLLNNIDWKKIEEEVYNPWFSIQFKLDGHTIQVQKGNVSDTRQLYSVYIDGVMKGKWNKDNFPIITKVWCKKTRSLHNKKFKESLIKIYGKRRAAKECDLDQKIEHYWGLFSSSKRWIGQFKKLEGLEQIEEEATS